MDVNSAWKKINDALANSDKESNDELYTEWSEQYDGDLDSVGYVIHKSLTTELMKYVRNTPDSQILDVAAGSGLLSSAVKEANFEGIIDCLEPNESFLRIAKSKGVCRNYIKSFVFQDKPLPVPDGSYDAVMSTGSFVLGHIPPAATMTLSRVLKPGGILAFNCRDASEKGLYLKEIEQCLENLVNNNTLKKLEAKDVLHYQARPAINQPEITSTVYLYRKL